MIPGSLERIAKLELASAIAVRKLRLGKECLGKATDCERRNQFSVNLHDKIFLKECLCIFVVEFGGLFFDAEFDHYIALQNTYSSNDVYRVLVPNLEQEIPIITMF